MYILYNEEHVTEHCSAALQQTAAKCKSPSCDQRVDRRGNKMRKTRSHRIIAVLVFVQDDRQKNFDIKAISYVHFLCNGLKSNE